MLVLAVTEPVIHCLNTQLILADAVKLEVLAVLKSTDTTNEELGPVMVYGGTACSKVTKPPASGSAEADIKPSWRGIF